MKRKLRTKPEYKTCPFIENSLADCYCSDMKSQNIKLALNFCGGDYKKCPIYVKASREGKRILVAEDDDIMSSALKAMLELAGHKVITASNGRMALDIILKNEGPSNPISLLITDLEMPLTDGIELIEKIGELKQHIPIVVITGYLDEQKEKKLLENRVEEIILKPFVMKAAVETANRILAKELEG